MFIRASPPITILGHSVYVTAELKGGKEEEVYCLSVEWTHQPGTMGLTDADWRSVVAPDCLPWEDLMAARVEARRVMGAEVSLGFAEALVRRRLAGHKGGWADVAAVAEAEMDDPRPSPIVRRWMKGFSPGCGGHRWTVTLFRNGKKWLSQTVEVEVKGCDQ